MAELERKAQELETRAQKAIVDKEYNLAVSLCSEAIDLHPSNPADLYNSRALAHILLENYTDAVADANKAIELDPSSVTAHLQKGDACFGLEEFQTAKAAVEAGLAVDPDHGQLKTLLGEIEAKLREEAAAAQQDVARSSESTPVDKVKEAPVGQVDATPMETANDDEDTVDVTPVANSTPTEPPKPKYRHEYYQSSNAVVVTVFAKNVRHEQLAVEFGAQALSLVIEFPGEEPYDLRIRLFGKIKTDACKCNLFPTKIEIKLAKAEPISWQALEYDPKLVVHPTPKIEPRPYPTSSKTGRTDWDKLEAQVKREEKEEKLEGDAALNKLFQDIYKDADEDTRRAMNKSFVESNGTVLSTNWKEVGNKEVDKSPPKGMEVKKWEQ